MNFVQLFQEILFDRLNKSKFSKSFRILLALADENLYLYDILIIQTSAAAAAPSANPVPSAAAAAPSANPVPSAAGDVVYFSHILLAPFSPLPVKIFRGLQQMDVPHEFPDAGPSKFG